MPNEVTAQGIEAAASGNATRVVALGIEAVVSASREFIQVTAQGAEASVSAVAGTRMGAIGLEAVVGPAPPVVLPPLDCPPSALPMPSTGIIGGANPLATDGVLPLLFDCDDFTVDSIDVGTVPDDGGVVIVATGTFPATLGGIVVAVVDTVSGLTRAAYSGVIGSGSLAVSEDGTTLSFVAPPFPIGGPYDLLFTPETGSPATLAAAITYVHRSFETNLFSLRANTPPPRQVGPWAIEDED